MHVSARETGKLKIHWLIISQPSRQLCLGKRQLFVFLYVLHRNCHKSTLLIRQLASGAQMTMANMVLSNGFVFYTLLSIARYLFRS